MSTAPDRQAIDLGLRWAQALLAPHVPVPAGAAAAPDGKALMAIGDAWFACFPAHAALDCLRRDHGYAVYSTARPGARLEEMGPASLQASGHAGQLGALAAQMAGVPEAERAQVLALLISAGGHDAIDDPARFESMLNPNRPDDPINEAGVHQVVDVCLRGRYITLLTVVTRLSVALLGRKVPILIHGYAHPVPDEHAAAPFGVSLYAVLKKLGYASPVLARGIMARLVDRLNAMQQVLLAQNAVDFQHVSHIDLRPVLCNDEHYRQYWADELHPTVPRGAGLVAAALQAKLRTLALS